MKNKSYLKILDDFKIGDVYHHWPGKTITESDNNLFCLLTMNHHPVHLDKEYAKERPHGQNIVVGTYVLSLVVGLTVADISGSAIAALEYENVKHLSPVFVGDTIYAKTTILDVKKSSSKPDRGIVEVETIAFNQHENKVLSFKRKILVPTRLLDTVLKKLKK